MKPLAKPRAIRVLLADDHALVRESLRALIEDDPGLSVVGEADDGEAAVALAPKLAPDVVLLDISMRRMGGIEAARRLRKEAPAARLVIISINDDLGHVLESFKAGARGYLIKDAAPEEIARAVERVHAGQIFCSELVVRSLLADGGGLRAQLGKARALPEFERQVLGRLVEEPEAERLALELEVPVSRLHSAIESLASATGASTSEKLRRLALAHLIA